MSAPSQLRRRIFSFGAKHLRTPFPETTLFHQLRYIVPLETPRYYSIHIHPAHEPLLTSPGPALSQKLHRLEHTSPFRRHIPRTPTTKTIKLPSTQNNTTIIVSNSPSISLVFPRFVPFHRQCSEESSTGSRRSSGNLENGSSKSGT